MTETRDRIQKCAIDGTTNVREDTEATLRRKTLARELENKVSKKVTLKRAWPHSKRTTSHGIKLKGKICGERMIIL